MYFAHSMHPKNHCLYYGQMIFHHDIPMNLQIIFFLRISKCRIHTLDNGCDLFLCNNRCRLETDTLGVYKCSGCHELCAEGKEPSGGLFA